MLLIPLQHIDTGDGTLVQPFSFNSGDVYSPTTNLTPILQSSTLTPNITNNQQTYIATGNFTILNSALLGVPAGFFISLQSTSVDRIITYNTISSFTLYASSGAINGGSVIAYWTGTQFTIYQP